MIVGIKTVYTWTAVNSGDVFGTEHNRLVLHSGISHPELSWIFAAISASYVV